MIILQMNYSNIQHFHTSDQSYICNPGNSGYIGVYAKKIDCVDRSIYYHDSHVHKMETTQMKCFVVAILWDGLK